MASNGDLQTTEDNDEANNAEVKDPEDLEVKSSQISEQKATVSQRIQHLRNQKKSSKSRLTKARNCLHNLIINETFQSKNTVRRQMKKVESEFDIVEKIIMALKENYAIDLAAVEHVQFPDIDTTIEYGWRNGAKFTKIILIVIQ